MGCTEKERFPNAGKQIGASGNAVVDQRTLLEFRGALIPRREIGKSKAEPQGYTEMGGPRRLPRKGVVTKCGVK